MKSILKLSLVFLFLQKPCSLHAESQSNDQSNCAKKEPPLWITIFVHGIFSPRPYLNLPNMFNFFRDKIADSTYTRSIEQTRLDPYFYQHHPMQGLGLRSVDMAATKKGAAARCYADLINLLESYSSKKNNNHYYTFGWSGLLSSRMRYLEAKIFYNQLLKELQHYHEQGIIPKLRIIGYSHGANVVLRLAEVYKREGYEKAKKIRIDQLIMIGAPVLPETDYLTNSSLFTKIYHFYSFGDRIQCLDFFSLDHVFSNRKFHERTDFAIPEKLVQINVKVKRPLAHRKKTTYPEKEIPYLLHHRSLMRNSDPGHTELWSFGWAPTSYRQSFPLNPLPFTIFVPYSIEQLNKAMPNAKSVILELHPFYEQMLFYDFASKQEVVTPFVKREQFSQLQKHAETFRPENFNRKSYNQKINDSIRKAQKDLFDEWQAEKKLKGTRRNYVYRTRYQKRKKSDIESC